MYAVYLRKSRADRELENREDVLKRHETALLELAEKRNYKIGKIFKEVASGETIASRPKMQELLSEVESGLWEGVLVMEVERLARGNTADQGIVSQTFKLSETLIITPSKIYNPSNEFDEEYFEFGLFMSRREYKTINRRLAAGRLASCREGKFVGSTPPYGFEKQRIKGQKGWKLVPVPEETEIVKQIYGLYLSGRERTGFQGIADRLEEMGITTRKGNNWRAPQIKYILTNDVYIGKIHWGQTPAVKKSKNGAVVTLRKRAENYTVFEGLHEAVISPEVFDRAQKIILSRKKTPENTLRPIQNPFAGVLVCGLCGKALKRRPPDPRRPNSRAFYCCPEKNCPNTGCPGDIIEEKITEGIKAWFSGYKIKLKDSGPDTSEINPSALTASCEKQIKRLQNQLEKTYSLLEQGIYDKEIFAARQSALKAEIDEKLKTAAKLKPEYISENTKEKYSLKDIKQEKTIAEIWCMLSDAKSKNEFIKALFKQIKYIKTEKGNRLNKKADSFEMEFITKLPCKAPPTPCNNLSV